MPDMDSGAKKPPVSPFGKGVRTPVSAPKSTAILDVNLICFRDTATPTAASLRVL
jgi:hypothetical protein